MMTGEKVDCSGYVPLDDDSIPLCDKYDIKTRNRQKMLEDVNWENHKIKISQISQHVAERKERERRARRAKIKQKITQQVIKRLHDRAWIKKKTERAAKKGKYRITLNKTILRNPLSQFTYFDNETKVILDEIAFELENVLTDLYGTNFYFRIERHWDIFADYSWKLCLAWI